MSAERQPATGFVRVPSVSQPVRSPDMGPGEWQWLATYIYSGLSMDIMLDDTGYVIVSDSEECARVSHFPTWGEVAQILFDQGFDI